MRQKDEFSRIKAIDFYFKLNFFVRSALYSDFSFLSSGMSSKTVPFVCQKISSGKRSRRPKGLFTLGA